MEFVYLFTGIVVGAVAAFFYFSLNIQKKQANLQNDFQVKEKMYEQQKVEAEKQGLVWQERFQSLKAEAGRLEVRIIRKKRGKYPIECAIGKRKSAVS